jgi:hypothetical protein
MSSAKRPESLHTLLPTRLHTHFPPAVFRASRETGVRNRETGFEPRLPDPNSQLPGLTISAGDARPGCGRPLSPNSQLPSPSSRFWRAYRRGPTRSHPEHDRETRQGLRYSEGNLPGDTVPARLPSTNSPPRHTRGGLLRLRTRPFFLTASEPRPTLTVAHDCARERARLRGLEL